MILQYKTFVQISSHKYQNQSDKTNKASWSINVAVNLFIESQRKRQLILQRSACLHKQATQVKQLTDKSPVPRFTVSVFLSGF